MPSPLPSFRAKPRNPARPYAAHTARSFPPPTPDPALPADTTGAPCLDSETWASCEARPPCRCLFHAVILSAAKDPLYLPSPLPLPCRCLFHAVILSAAKDPCICPCLCRHSERSRGIPRDHTPPIRLEAFHLRPQTRPFLPIRRVPHISILRRGHRAKHDRRCRCLFHAVILSAAKDPCICPRLCRHSERSRGTPRDHTPPIPLEAFYLRTQSPALSPARKPQTPNTGPEGHAFRRANQQPAAGDTALPKARFPGI